MSIILQSMNNLIKRHNCCENRSLATLFKPTFETANYEKWSDRCRDLYIWKYYQEKYLYINIKSYEQIFSEDRHMFCSCLESCYCYYQFFIWIIISLCNKSVLYSASLTYTFLKSSSFGRNFLLHGILLWKLEKWSQIVIWCWISSNLQ